MSGGPSKEIPRVSSFLRWEKVTLPPAVSEADLDKLIFAELGPLSRKVAAIIARVTSRCAEMGLPISDKMIGARLIALAEADQIVGLGDLRQVAFQRSAVEALIIAGIAIYPPDTRLITNRLPTRNR